MTEERFKEIENIYRSVISIKSKIKNHQNKIQSVLHKLKDESISVCDKRDYEDLLKIYSNKLQELTQEYNKL